ncbi:uncharacterized protein THITE_2129515 [Thermothielavioides terrestris NRRL 8126]|uniref:Uncharacterized protein n=1 Tax=Thermothielavioides terrestris (strain ATCC 38088 / NRRL 8126) TaxID=578455 RepID=G2R6G8_THETT|nr:uncharacterized protein THITE_2129515 [Thermothielavioides terrestris NRRL 8126]AEO67653.1 hypothetical protein THITE_2129515 [Thermothielavioides terrestris NRRL 8126]
MRLPLWAATLWISALFALTEAVFVRSSSGCAPNEYWCQDRCGSADYGDTCCQTPDGQHNLCGAVCNAVGGCDSVPGLQVSAPDKTYGSPPGTQKTASTSEPYTESGSLSTVTSQVFVTQVRTRTIIVTLTSSRSCTSEGNHSSSGNPSTEPASGEPTTFSSRLLSTEPSSCPQGFSTEFPQCAFPGTSEATSAGSTTGDFTGIPTGWPTSSPPSNPTTSASTWTDSLGETIVSSGSEIVIGGTETIPVPTGHSTLTTDGHTFTFGSGSGNQPRGVAPATT